MITFLEVSGGAMTLFVIVGLGLYFIPAIIAHDNRNASTVVIINLFFGWTLIGWVVALILAFADSKPVVIQQSSKADKYDQLQKLEDLRTKGVLSTEEFMKEKRKVMEG